MRGSLSAGRNTSAESNWELLDSDLQQAVLSLRDVCAQCRLSSLVIRLRLRWWLVRMALLPFAQPPKFKTLLRLGSADMISFYKNARSLARPSAAFTAQPTIRNSSRRCKPQR